MRQMTACSRPMTDIEPIQLLIPYVSPVDLINDAPSKS